MDKELLKSLLRENVTKTSINHFKGLQLLSMTCFWVRENFSAVLKFRGRKYYCYYNRAIEDFTVQYC